MNTTDAAIRYSKALFNVAVSNEDLEKRLHDLTQIVETFKKFPRISIFFSSPQITVEEKKKALNAAVGKVDKELRSFLFLLLDKKRFKYLPEILEFYRSMVTAKLGALEVRFITATPIDAETGNNLKSKLEQKYRKKIIIKEEIDPTIIGGGVLLIGNEQIDFSIRGKLAKLKKDLLSIRV